MDLLDTLTPRRIGTPALKGAVRFWYVIMSAGQLLWLVHIVGFYSPTLSDGDMKRWNKILLIGYRPGDKTGNAALAAHIAMAGILTFGGVLQLLP